MLHSSSVRVLGFFAVSIVLLAASGSARAQVYVHRVVALYGDPAPGTGGKTYGTFGLENQNIDASGYVPFQVLFDSFGDRGIFLDSGGTSRAVALVGDPAPGGGNFILYGLDIPSINASGDVAFQGSYGGGGSGVFLDSGGTLTAVARRFDPAPGGGSYSSPQRPRISDSGEVMFYASRELPLGGSGIFVEGSPDRVVALVGDSAPDTGGGTFQNISSVAHAINASGDVVFYSGVTGGTSGITHGLFMDSGGTDTAVALPGDPAPGTGGGTYSNVAGNPPGISAAGDVVFYAGVTGGTTPGGIFLATGGTDTAVALYGDPAPGGGSYGGFGIPTISPAGDVAFTIDSGNRLIAVSGGEARVVANDGDSAPGTGGGTFTGFTSVGAINPSGDVAFYALVTGGTAGTGIFKAELAPPVPALGAPGVALACLLLGIAGALAVARPAAGRDGSST